MREDNEEDCASMYAVYLNIINSINKTISNSDDDIVLNSLSNSPMDTCKRMHSTNSVSPSPSAEENTEDQLSHIYRTLSDEQSTVKPPSIKTLLNPRYKMNLIHHQNYLAM